jgi:hypothetical protein
MKPKERLKMNLNPIDLIVLSVFVVYVVAVYYGTRNPK